MKLFEDAYSIADQLRIDKRIAAADMIGKLVAQTDICNKQLEERDKRILELLNDNNAMLERAREAEQKADAWRDALMALARVAGAMAEGWGHDLKKWTRENVPT